MATPLAISPSPPAIASDPFAAPPRNRQHLLSRPKLSLNTATCTTRTLGRGNTGLRLDILTTDSPTSINTFRNTYDDIKPCTLSHEATAPLSHASLISLDTTSADVNSHILDIQRRSSADSTISNASTTSTTSSSTTPPHSPPATYTIPAHIRPILTNSRLPKRSRSAISATSTPKLLFPPLKRVCFRVPLEEEVRNEVFRARHSDIVDCDADKESGEDAVQQDSKAGEEDEAAQMMPTGRRRSSPPPNKRPRPQRGSHDAVAEKAPEADEDDDTDAAYSQTPVAGRRKRVREWRWTLGPLSTSTDGADDVTRNAASPDDEHVDDCSVTVLGTHAGHDRNGDEPRDEGDGR